LPTKKEIHPELRRNADKLKSPVKLTKNRNKPTNFGPPPPTRPRIRTRKKV
jgi:hypothetical protein